MMEQGTDTPLTTCATCKKAHRKCLHGSAGTFDAVKCRAFLDVHGHASPSNYSQNDWSAIVQAGNSIPQPSLASDTDRPQSAADQHSRILTDIPSDNLVSVDRTPGLAYDEGDTVSQRSPEASPRHIDMSMWMTSVSPARRATSDDVSSTKYTSTAKAISFDEQTRRPLSVDSTDSNPSSIPYDDAPDNQEALTQVASLTSPADTIVLRDDPKGVIGSHNPLEIRIWEGSEELHEFPSNLCRQLQYACAEQHTSVPDCVKTAWHSPKTVYHAGIDRRARFVNPVDGKTLLMARYHYGTGFQIVVVKQQNGQTLNGGEAAIVNYVNINQTSYTTNGQNIIKNTWKIWNPYNMHKEATYVERLMELDSMEKLKKPVTIPRSLTETPDLSRKRPRLGQGPEEDSISSGRDSRIIANGGVKRDVGEGFRCPICPRESIRTLRGVFDHCRVTHSIYLSDNTDKMADQPSKLLQPPGDTSRPKTPPRLTPNNGPFFVFQPSDTHSKPRTRPLKVCNSAEKLFVNAMVAGVARKDTLVLTVQVGHGRPFNIIRGDAEDYNTVMEAINVASTDKESLQVIITAEDFDL